MPIYKKKNRWYIDYFLPDGKRKREVVKVEGVDPKKVTRQDALNALSIRRGELARGTFDITRPAKPIRFETLVKQYLEFSELNKRPNSYARDITSSKQLCSYYGGKKLDQLNNWLVEKYKASRKKELNKYGRTPSNACINRELAMLKHMFNKAIEWNLVVNNPAAKVKLFPEKPKQRVISIEEFEKLYDAASNFLKPILFIAVNTGLRRSEILNLKHSDIDLENEYILVRETKSGESRHVQINKRLKQELLSIPKREDCVYLFPGRSGLPVKDIKRGFAGARQRSGIEHLRFHDLRHSFGSSLGMAGVDLATIAEIMGHKDISTTKRYIHPSPKHKKEAVEKIEYSTDTSYDTSARTRKKLKVLR